MHPLDYIKALDHHAYFIQSFKDSVSHLKDLLKEKFHIHSAKNPDFFHEKFETLGVDDSRRIKEIHISKSFTPNSKRIFIIEAVNITHEAQNSLLKIFEEPNTDSHFFLIMPSPHILLPTLRSRLNIIRSNVIDNKEIIETSDAIKKAEQFLNLSRKDKVVFVDEMAKDISDEKIHKGEAQEFLAALEVVIYRKKGLEKADGLKAILKARDYINDRSPSVKQLLEFVALSL